MEENKEELNVTQDIKEDVTKDKEDMSAIEEIKQDNANDGKEDEDDSEEESELEGVEAKVLYNTTRDIIAAEMGMPKSGSESLPKDQIEQMIFEAQEAHIAEGDIHVPKEPKMGD